VVDSRHRCDERPESTTERQLAVTRRVRANAIRFQYYQRAYRYIFEAGY
jgi:hypothetical protein